MVKLGMKGYRWSCKAKVDRFYLRHAVRVSAKYPMRGCPGAPGVSGGVRSLRESRRGAERSFGWAHSRWCTTVSQRDPPSPPGPVLSALACSRVKGIAMYWAIDPLLLVH